MCSFVGILYYTLGNLHPKYRSSLVAIQLVAVVNHSLMQKYDYKDILGPFIDDIKALESVRLLLFLVITIYYYYHFVSNSQ